MEYMNRHIDVIVKNSIATFPSILITGPRQVGKTTLLKHVAPTYHYITLDDVLLASLAEQDASLFFKSNPLPLIIDEIQYVPNLMRQVKIIVDNEVKRGQILMTGSQPFHLMQNVSESLAGRIDIFHLQGLSLREKFAIDFRQAFVVTESYIEQRRQQLVQYENLWEHIHRGGMPALVDKQISWSRYYESYIQTYIERDVKQLTEISNQNLFTRFMVSLAARTGQLLNYTSIANDIGVSVETIKRWVSILEASGIIFLLEPYANNILQRVIKTPKLYFFDTALVSYLTRWLTPETLENGRVSGEIFETFVVSEIYKSYLNAGITRPPLYYYRDRDQKEIDLIIEKDGTLIPIEITKSATPTKQMAKNFTVLDKVTSHKIGLGAIICQCNQLLYLDENLVALPLEYV